MSRYLPQETHVVCSYQMNPSPGALLVDPKMWNRSVVYKSEKQPLLTEVDKVLKDDFECKSNWGQAAGWSFLVAGLALGLAVAFSICTFGVGAIVLGAVAVAATVLIASNSTKCNPNLVEWINPHSSVKFEGHKALTQKSFLKCSAGPGILTPFLDEAEAKSAAKNVAFRNWGEVSLTAVISGLFGYGVGLSAGTAAVAAGGGLGALGPGLFAGGKEAAVGIVGAYLIFQPISTWEAQGMQGIYSGDGNTTYDQMLTSRQEMESSFTVDSPDDPYIGTSQTGAAGELLNLSYDKYRQNQNEKYIKEIMNLKGTRAEREARTAEIVAEMKKTRSGAQAVEAMKRKGSGKILPREKTSNKGNRVINEHRAETNKAMKGQAAEGFGGAINVAGLVLPLLVSPLNEWTFSVLADSFANQSAGGVTINAAQN
ncbi:PAAR-like protein [Chryseobacterium tructae]|uniref:PAAR-like protein n=1 Tax=Chryseobacterium tructae TaxID=1037380 RepID=A0ABV7Y130_9FLAO|nr:PAAR-like protein [Chryseobacterium tructae]MDN3694506.1 PAAR-like protein [Chryseobacterium tructae]